MAAWGEGRRLTVARRSATPAGVGNCFGKTTGGCARASLNHRLPSGSPPGNGSCGLPEIARVVLDAGFLQELEVFFLESFDAMMFLLVEDVFDHRVAVR